MAWQGRAESAGMIEAVRVASRLAGRRMKDDGGRAGARAAEGA